MSRTQVVLRSATDDDVGFLVDLWASSLRQAAPELRLSDLRSIIDQTSSTSLQRLVIADELQTLVEQVPGWIPSDSSGAEIVVEIVARSVEYCMDHQLLSKVRSDEPELLAGLLVGAVPDVIARLSEVFATPVEVGMALGLLADRDAAVIVEWCVRIGLSLLVAPPPGNLRAFLAAVLEPVLDPATIPVEET